MADAFYKGFQPPAPLKLEGGNLEEAWKVWIQKFDLFLLASRSDELPEKIQVAMFLSAIGDEGLHVFNTFKFEPEEDKNKIEAVRAKFKDYCSPRKNVVFERFQFWKCSQAPGESIDGFVTTLRLRAKTCEFGDQEESLIRDRVVLGCTDCRLQERLLREPDLSLTKALQICRAAEATAEQMKMIRGDDTTTINSLKSEKYSSSRRNNNEHTGSSDRSTCRKCGTRHPPKQCPAFGKICFKCQKENHFGKLCRSSSRLTVRDKMQDRSAHSPAGSAINSLERDITDFDIGEVKINSCSKDQDHKNSWWKEIVINGKKVSCKLDTGAEANVMPASVFERLPGKPRLQKTKTVLTAYGNSKIQPLGTTTLEARINEKKQLLEFYIVDIRAPTIIGLISCCNLKILQRIDSFTADPGVNTVNKLLDEFGDVFEGIGQLSREHHISVDPTIQPVIHPPRRVPLALQPRLKSKLESLVHSGIIEKRDEPTDWVNSLIIVEKKDGSLRLCLDPRDLNKAIKGEHFSIPTCDDILPKLHGRRVFSIIDMKDGFWQVKLDDSSCRLCTFNTPFGRYSFRRLPFGISSAPEVFQKRSLEIFADIEGVFIVFDDLIIAAKDETQHDLILRKVLERAREANVRFNKAKLQLKVSSVKYLGHLISAAGVAPDTDKVTAILDMPVPNDKKSLQRFLGMVTYISKFIPNLSSITEPLRQLLKRNMEWIWNNQHERAIAQLKKSIATAPVLKFFDPKAQTCIQTDASSTGLGSVLLQNGQPVAYASRALTETETRYAQIERELLAIVYACEKFSHYIYGSKTLVYTDHKPLESVLLKPLYKSSPRLQRMLLRLLKFEIELKYIPGSQMHVADALSRATTKHIDVSKEQELQDDIEVMVHTILNDFPASNKRLDQFRLETDRDPELHQLKTWIRDGFPVNMKEFTTELKRYQTIAGELYELDGLLFHEGKLVVPKVLRKEMLHLLHEGHLGIEKTKAIARSCLYWPGISSEIEETVSRCPVCNSHRRKQQREPMMPHEVPQRPWAKVGVDLFQFAAKDYLLVVDYFSKYPEIALLEDKTSVSVILQLKAIFARHGIPEEIMADNMPFSSRQLQLFAQDWDFKITTSSPRYPKSNGQAERMIQTVKQLLRKAHDSNTDPYIALLQYRNAPLAGLDVSPAQLLMSRSLRTKLPALNQNLQPRVQNARNELVFRQQKQKIYHDRSSRPLPSLKEGDVVRVQHNGAWTRGEVSQAHSSPRSYIVNTEEGSALRRNRRDLIQTKENPPLGRPTMEDVTAQIQDQGMVEVTASAPHSPTISRSSDHQPMEELTEPTELPSSIKPRSGRTVKLPVRFSDYLVN